MTRTFDSPRRDAPRKVAIRVRVKPSVKVMAQQLAQKDARSLADWLERLIAAEAERRGGKR
jgi:predicted HicB family RNase H-like nuclease